MKTFSQFIKESKTTQRLIIKSAELIKRNKDNPEKVQLYKNIIKKAQQRLKSNDNIDYSGRTAARKDKNLIPSHRTSSFPELSNVSTTTKNPKKLRKQRALGEID